MHIRGVSHGGCGFASYGVVECGCVLVGVAALAGGLVSGCGGALKGRLGQPGRGRHLRTNLRKVVAQSRDRVFPALVNIYVVTVDYYGGKEHKNRAVGSGTIISKDGYVVTNQHVTNDGKKFRCTLANEEEIPATLVGEDPLTDLAVLKLEPRRAQEQGRRCRWRRSAIPTSWRSAIT